MKNRLLKIGLAIGLTALLIISAQAQSGENLFQKMAHAEMLNIRAATLIDDEKFAEAVKLHTRPMPVLSSPSNQIALPDDI